MVAPATSTATTAGINPSPLRRRLAGDLAVDPEARTVRSELFRPRASSQTA